MWALPGPHLGSSSPARRASPPTRRRRPPSRPSRRGSRRALRGIRPSGAGTVRRQGVSYPRVSRASKLCLGGAGREGRDAGWNSQGAGFETRPPFLPFWARFYRYFWLFLAISGLGASPGGPGSKLIILRATGESQESALLYRGGMEFGKFFSGWQIILLRHTGDFQKTVLLKPAMVVAGLHGCRGPNLRIRLLRSIRDGANSTRQFMPSSLI